MKSQDCLIGFLFGAAVGVAVGLSWAPKEGSATREQIARTAKDGVDRLKRHSQDLTQAVSSFVSKDREQLKERLIQTV